ncbi:hypothetical protein BDV93DRAFT_562569 [Ceratobasidium sp. AG-I]|nr:hypothetical protein BDV93DRAFT_562569 [Ceratobasidium sp. AG-I]
MSCDQTLSAFAGRDVDTCLTTLHSPLLSSQMDSTSYTVSQSVQVEQPVDQDQSSNGGFYCVIA